MIPNKRFLTFILTFSLFIFSSLFAQEVDRSKIEEEAKKEGKLVWYTSMLTPDAWRILYEFNDKYPYIEVDLYRAGSFSVKSKYEEELQNGEVKVDVLHTADIGTFLEFEDSQKLLYYDSSEYDAFPEEYKSSGYWAAMRGVSVCIAYNASKVSQDEAPRSWMDIFENQDRWKGKIAVGNVTEGGGTMYAQYYFLRRLYGVDYWQNLVTLGPTIDGSSYNIMESLVSGEVDVALTSLGYMVYNYSIKKGLPIRGVWPEDGVPMQPCPVAIASDAPHPNAAKLFMDFVLSLEGQTLCQAIVGCYSVREGVPALPSKIPFSEINRPFKIDWRNYSEKVDNYKDEFAKIMNLEIQSGNNQ